MLWLLRLLTRAALRRFGARPFRFETRSASMTIYRTGPAGGEPWLLVHGLGSTTLSWHAVLKALRRDCDLVLPEMSELGGTRIPGGGLNVREGVEVLADIIMRLFPGKKVTVAGVSLGGWMATRLALDHPNLIKQLVLVNAAGFQDQDWHRIQDLVDVRNLEDVERLYGALFHGTPFYMALARRGFLRAYKSRAVRRVIGSIEPADGFSRADLQRLEMPVALVWSDQDGLFTLEVGREMDRALRHSKLYVLENCGHAAQWDCPAAMAAAIRDIWRQP